MNFIDSFWSSIYSLNLAFLSQQGGNLSSLPSATFESCEKQSSTSHSSEGKCFQGENCLLCFTSHWGIPFLLRLWALSIPHQLLNNHVFPKMFIILWKYLITYYKTCSCLLQESVKSVIAENSCSQHWILVNLYKHIERGKKIILLMNVLNLVSLAFQDP